MDPTKKPDTSLSLEELIKRDRMKAKLTKKKTLKPKVGAKKVFPVKKPIQKLPAPKGGKTLNMKQSDKKQQSARPDLKVRRKIIQKGNKMSAVKNPERKPLNTLQRGNRPAPQQQQRHGVHGKQQQQTPRSSKGPQLVHKTHQQNRAPLQRRDSHHDQNKGGKQRERHDNRPPVERRDPKVVRYSDVRLKLRNLDCQKVTNFEITKLFEGIGELVKCKFDYNDFGNFLGSATVQFKRPEDAKKAIDEYHGAELEGKVITIEPDVESGRGGRDNSTAEKSNNVIFLRTNKSMVTPEVAMVPASSQGNSGIVALSGAVSSASPIVPSHNAGGGAYTHQSNKAYGRGPAADRHAPRK